MKFIYSAFNHFAAQPKTSESQQQFLAFCTNLHNTGFNNSSITGWWEHIFESSLAPAWNLFLCEAFEFFKAGNTQPDFLTGFISFFQVLLALADNTPPPLSPNWLVHFRNTKRQQARLNHYSINPPKDTFEVMYFEGLWNSVKINRLL